MITTLFENWLLETSDTGTTQGFLTGERRVKGNPFRTAKVKEWREKDQLSQSRTRPGGLRLRGRQKKPERMEQG